MSQEIATDDVLIVEYVEQYASVVQIAVQRRYYKVGAATVPGAITFSDVATDLSTPFAPLIIALMNDNAAYHGCRVRRVRPASIDQWAFSTSGSGSGTAGAVAVPSQVTGLISLDTAMIGPRWRGRVYVPFLAVDDILTNGQLSGSAVTRLAALGTFLASTAVVTAPGGGSRPLFPVITNGVDPILTEVVTTHRETNSTATQRRRGAYGKTNRLPF